MGRCVRLSLRGKITMRKTIRSLRKRDVAVLGGITAALLIAIFVMTGTTNLYGSIIDWVSQHSVLPEYYRQTFYETGEFLPEFALQLGGGQNAYYFGYYGFLNPVYLPSYLMPGVSMVTYLQFASVVMLIASVWLGFLWLRHIQIAFGPKAALSDRAIYTATSLLALATPLLFHSRRQVMFVDYMPFLLLALIGVDRFFSRRRRGLLTVSVALLFFTSYFYAIPGLVVVTLYGIYRYVFITEKFEWKTFWQWGWRFALCIIAGTAVASVLTIPSMMAILSGREPGATPKMDLFHLLIGDMDFAGAVCYSGYSMGMTALAYLAICVLAVPRRKREEDDETAGNFRAEAVLAIGVLACAWLPWVRYILNGFLYAREKILIPFVPIGALLIAILLHKLTSGELPLRRFTAIALIATGLGVAGYMFRGAWSQSALFAADAVGTVYLARLAVKRNNLRLLTVPAIVLALVVTIVYSVATEKPVSRAYAQKLYDEDRDRAISEVLSRNDGVYRSADFVEVKYGVNRLRGKRYLSTGFYSSLSNVEYLKLLYGDLGAANPTVNDISFTPQNDIFLQTLLGVRYVATETDAPAGYARVDDAREGDVRVYENPGAYTLAFAGAKRMSLREFRTLSAVDRELALLSYVVTEEDGPDVYKSPLEDAGVKIDFGLEPGVGGNLHVADSNVAKTYTVPIPDSLNEYIYVVTLRIAERHDHRTVITVNGITGVLSGKDNSRPNNNFDMKFVVSSAEPCRELTFQFTGENVDISEPKVQRVKVSELAAARANMTMATELSNPKNNKITGKIAPESDGILVVSVPYDENWTIRVNGTETPVLRADNGLVGCAIAAGEQAFEMIYHAPGRTAGICVSLAGLLGWALLVIVPRLRKKTGEHRA
jgi:Bacterial membrane protein YfhO.